MMPRYIIESRNGNPAIMKLVSDGTYVKLAFGTGEDTLPVLLELVALANTLGR